MDKTTVEYPIILVLRLDSFPDFNSYETSIRNYENDGEFKTIYKTSRGLRNSYTVLMKIHCPKYFGV